MKSLIKYFLIAVILALIIAITPMLTGIGLQAKIDDLILHFNGAQSHLTLERVNYKSGWFTSTVTIKEKDVPASEKTFKVLHGPIFWAKGSLGFGYGELLEQGDLKLSIRIGFTGGIAIQEVINADQIKTWKQDFSADKMVVNVDTNSDFSKIDLDFAALALSAKPTEETPIFSAGGFKFTAKAVNHKEQKKEGQKDKTAEKSADSWLINFGYEIDDFHIKEKQNNGEFVDIKSKKLAAANINIDTSLLPMLPPPFDAVLTTRSLRAEESPDFLTFLTHVISQSATNKTIFEIDQFHIKDNQAEAAIDKITVTSNANADVSEINLDFALKTASFKEGNDLFSIDDIKFKLKALTKSDEKTHGSWLLTFGYDLVNLSLQMQEHEGSKINFKMNKLAANDINFDTALLDRFGKVFNETMTQTEMSAEYEAEVMKLITDLMSQAVTNKTNFELDKLHIATPFFTDLTLNIMASWPDLPANHDYLDLNWDVKSKIEFHLPKLEVPLEHDGKLLIEEVKYNVDNNKGTGKFNASFSKVLKSATEEMSAIELDKFSFNLLTTSEPEKFSYDGKMNLQKICVLDQCGENADLKFTIKNLSKKALRDIYMSTLMKAGSDPMGNIFTLLGAYGNLVESDSEVTLAFSVKTPDGDIKIDANANWKNMPQKKELFGAFAYIQYQVNGKFPAKLIDSIIASAATNKDNAEIAEKIQHLIQAKKLEKKGNEYILNMH